MHKTTVFYVDVMSKKVNKCTKLYDLYKCRVFFELFKFKCKFFSAAYIKLGHVIYHFKERCNRIIMQKK